MLSKTANHNKKPGSTRLAAIRVSNIDDSLEVTLTHDLLTSLSGLETILLTERLQSS